MNHYIYQCIVRTGSLGGLETHLPSEFKQIYKIVGAVWPNIKPPYINVTLTQNNALFLAKEKGTDKILGFIIGTIYPDNTLHDTIFKEWIVNEYGGINDKQDQFFRIAANNMKGLSKIRMFVTAKPSQNRGIGKSLFHSFLLACGNEFIQWYSSCRNSYYFYLRQNHSYLMNCSEDGIMIFMASNDKKKQALLRQYHMYMPFPENEHYGICKRLQARKDFYTTRVSEEKDRYKVGKIYLTSFGYLVIIKEKQEYSNITEHPFYKQLTTTQINEIVRYGKTGFCVYTVGQYVTKQALMQASNVR
jgi:hypothetical protein